MKDEAFTVPVISLAIQPKTQKGLVANFLSFGVQKENINLTLQKFTTLVAAFVRAQRSPAGRQREAMQIGRRIDKQAGTQAGRHADGQTGT
jgi:hypothetical protein